MWPDVVQGLLDQAEDSQVDMPTATRRQPWWVVAPVLQVRGGADINLQKAQRVGYLPVPMTPRPRLHMSCLLS